jgi:hypothetical protein
MTRYTDPYRQDTPARHRDGSWFAEQVAALVQPYETIHLRGLHYRLVAAANRILPDGKTVYVNTTEMWDWLTDTAAKAARWLGYVPFDKVIDNRNASPMIFAIESPPLDTSLAPGQRAALPGIDQMMPSPTCSGVEAAQPYRIIMFGEKASLEPVLRTVAYRCHAELILATGDASDTLIYGVAQRAAADGRPAVVLYFSDFDPSGRNMPTCVARKLQALRTLCFGDLDIKLFPVALTLDQVIEHNLPSTPLKASEKRADKWVAAFGREQTEIDALAALNPAALQRIAEEAIAPFWDPDLSDRAIEAVIDWEDEAKEALQDHPHYDEWHELISTARAEVAAKIDELLKLQEAAEADLDDLLPDLEAVEPEYDDTDAPEPLFNSEDDFETATEALINHKDLAA